MTHPRPARHASTPVAKQPRKTCRPTTVQTTHAHVTQASPTVKAWHSDDHVAARRFMIARLRKLHPLLKAPMATAAALPELVLRLELMLYKAANSMSEYLNECTLERRIQALVTHLQRPASALLVAPARTGRKRSWTDVSTTTSTANTKKPRGLLAWRQSVALLNGNVDVLARVCSFLDGHDVWRCRQVNYFFYQHAPSMVRSLTVDVGNATHAHLDGRIAGVLAQCTRLESLTLTNARSAAKPTSFSRTFVAAPVDFGQNAFTGSSLLLQVAKALREPSHCRRLESLTIRAPFECAVESEATIVCLRALVTPGATRSLTHLVLESNVLGDARAETLAKLMAAHPATFDRLQHLSLRNNFIGEAGMHALTTQALPVCANALQRLDLGRNIITDTNVVALAQQLDHHTSPVLEELQLDENYIGWSGFHALAKVLATRQARVSHCHALPSPSSPTAVAVRFQANCLANADAGRLFKQN